jgi:hypothetical protein
VAKKAKPTPKRTGKSTAKGPTPSGESAEPKPAPPDWSPKIYSFRNILQETVWVVGDSCVLGHYRSEAEAKAAFERNVAERAKKEKADDHEAAP